jgi:hypothetical protein
MSSQREIAGIAPALAVLFLTWLLFPSCAVSCGPDPDDEADEIAEDMMDPLDEAMSPDKTCVNDCRCRYWNICIPGCERWAHGDQAALDWCNSHCNSSWSISVGTLCTPMYRNSKICAWDGTLDMSEEASFWDEIEAEFGYRCPDNDHHYPDPGSNPT